MVWRKLVNAWLHPTAPISLVHFVTRRCDASCPHCFVEPDPPAGPELTLAAIRRVAMTAGPALLNVNLTGGEPFLRPDLAEIAGVWQQAGIASLYITTNGSQPDAVRELVTRCGREGWPAALTIAVSFDGIGENHDRRRGIPRLYEQALKSYRAAAGLPGVRALATVTVTPDNYRELDAIRDGLRGAGVAGIVATLYRVAGRAAAPDPETGRQLLAAYRRFAQRLADDLRQGRSGEFSRSWPGRLLAAKNTLLTEEVARVAGGRAPTRRCLAGRRFAVLEADGTVRACEMPPGLPLGRIQDWGGDFMRLWRSPGAAAARTQLAAAPCVCTYECALTINILMAPGEWPRLLWRAGRAR